MTESIRLTIDSLNEYGPRHKHWAVAWSGGKDSTALLTLLVYLLDAGKIPRPQSLHVFYADTRLELQPLWLVAQDIRDELRERGIEVATVMAPLDKRFLVYILGRGVPPPNNNTMRWCTRQIKIDPMTAALEQCVGHLGEKVLMLTGVRQGESAIRDGRIAMSCGRDWAHLGPLKRLRPIWRELREPKHRLRKPGAEVLKSGELAKNPQRMGPILLETRRWALDHVLAIQAEVNAGAAAGGRAPIDLLNAEEITRIEELIAARTWPDGWSGDEPVATTMLDRVFQDGSVQPLLDMFGDADR